MITHIDIKDWIHTDQPIKMQSVKDTGLYSTIDGVKLWYDSAVQYFSTVFDDGLVGAPSWFHPMIDLYAYKKKSN
jgi:hypothetical protein